MLVCSFSITMRLFADSPIRQFFFHSFIHSMFNWPESLKDQMLDVYLIISNANIRRKFKTEKYLRFESIWLTSSVCVRAREQIHSVFLLWISHLKLNKQLLLIIISDYKLKYSHSNAILSPIAYETNNNAIWISFYFCFVAISSIYSNVFEWKGTIKINTLINQSMDFRANFTFDLRLTLIFSFWTWK